MLKDAGWDLNDYALRCYSRNYGDLLYVRGDGNVGIGTTAPSEKLSVDGTIAIKEQTSSPSSTTDWGKIYTKSDNKLYFKDGADAEHEISLAI